MAPSVISLYSTQVEALHRARILPIVQLKSRVLLVSAPDSQILRERVWCHTIDQLVLTIQMKGPNQIAAFTCTTVYAYEFGIQPWMLYR